MHKNATKCNETLRKWCKNKHGASKIMDTLETYQGDQAMRDQIITAIALGVRRIAVEHTLKGARGELMRRSGGCTRIAATTKKCGDRHSTTRNVLTSDVFIMTLEKSVIK
jgi:hypothetical protein